MGYFKNWGKLTEVFMGLSYKIVRYSEALILWDRIKKGVNSLIYVI